MRIVPSAMSDAWKSEDKTGPRRPTVRATIQKGHMRKFEYDTAQMQGGTIDTVKDAHKRGVYTSMVFGDFTGQREIRNIKNYTWTRSLDQDVATCTLTIQNSDITPLGNANEIDPNGEFDLPGYFTFSRGDQKASENRWGYTQNAWNHVFVPDAVVKTWEGYGVNENAGPYDDENLLQSGTWLIDTVTYTADGEITLEMRDLGRLLLDQIVFPPVIPYEHYPLTWSKMQTKQVDGRDATGGAWKELKGHGKATSSNSLYVGLGIQDPPGKYVTAGGGVQGHYPSHALVDTKAGADDDSYWLSTGQETQASRVWWQIDFNNPTALNALRIQAKHGPYRVYISVKGPNGWIGRKKIPYEVTTEGVDLNADIPFVKQCRAETGAPFEVVLPRVYREAEAVRLTFSRLWDSKVGNYPFHAGLRDLMIYTADDPDALDFAKGKVMKTVGNYKDYTDLVKWVAAWGGFYWPPHSTGADFIKEGVNKRYVTYASRERKLAKGRAWGDFMNTGTAGEADLTADTFDKKPLMDIINYVRDLTGFVFFVDETGGIVWRMANLGLGNWNNKVGNWLSPTRFGEHTRRRTPEVITISEKETLQEYSTTLDSGEIRERIFVANVTGKTGTVIRGFNPHPNGMRRVAGWTDQHFRNKRDCRVMADMTAARSMFEYRRGRVKIPGHPGIQCDDQVRIFERMTNETYYHYVLGITSTLDMENGTWDYELETHWLGEKPSDAWAVKVDQLDTATKNYLNLLGADES